MPIQIDPSVLLSLSWGFNPVCDFDTTDHQKLTLSDSFRIASVITIHASDKVPALLDSFRLSTPQVKTRSSLIKLALPVFCSASCLCQVQLRSEGQ